MNASKFRLLIPVVALLLMTCLLVVFPGCGGEPGVEEIWEKSQEAEKNIDSLHMEIAISYENTDFGTGQIQTTTIDVSGDNVHATSSLFGQEFTEVIVVGGKQYTRMTQEAEWTESSVTFNPQEATQPLEGLANLPAVASSSENLGLKTIGGVDAYQLSFTLAPGDISGLFKNVEASQLSANAGGDINVWVEEETYYRIKYEALVRNALITEQIGYGDIRIVATISNINEPITITPPS